MTAGKALAHPLFEIRGVEISDGFERSDDIDRGTAVAGAACDAAGEVDKTGCVAVVGDEDNLKRFGLEMTGLVVDFSLYEVVGAKRGGENEPIWLQ